jgi:hypothetical protein
MANNSAFQHFSTARSSLRLSLVSLQLVVPSLIERECVWAAGGHAEVLLYVIPAGPVPAKAGSGNPLRHVLRA